MNTNKRRIPFSTASIAFWIWCCLLSYPMISEGHDPADLAHTFATSRIALVCQAIGLALFLTTMFLGYFARISAIIGSLSLVQVAMLLIIYLSFALQLHDNEVATFVGIFYTALLLAAALMLSAFWSQPAADLERYLTVASVILCLSGITAIAILGWPQGRSVGNIQPNLFATPLLAAFIFSQFQAGLIGIAVRILCLSMVALVSSRFALIGCISALAVYELTFKPLSPGKIPALAVALVAVMVFWPQIATILALDDSNRDLSSGFSGRDKYWDSALAAIAENPFGIGFKRALGDESGHNGYLKTLLEFGVVGGGLMIVFLGCNLVMAGIDAVRRSEVTQQHRFACARFGGLVALSFGAFFQPQLLSLGDAFGIAFLLLLFRPTATPPRERVGLAPDAASSPYQGQFRPAMPAPGTPHSARPDLTSG
jgi:O-antigen ligase